jgi:hypothetical protein
VITLGIDCGRQSLKTVALDGDSGKVIASASKAYGLVEGLPVGHLEQDPAIWWYAPEKTVQNALADLGSRKAEVAGIGVCSQQHGFSRPPTWPVLRWMASHSAWPTAFAAWNPSALSPPKSASLAAEAKAPLGARCSPTFSATR